MKPGDLIGFQTKGLFAALIRIGQRLAKVKHWHITHIAVVASGGDDPSIIQSVRVVDEVALSSYGDTPHVVIPFPGLDANRPDVVAFAHAALGRKYGVLSVVSRALNCLTPKAMFSFNRGGDCDCSTLGARAFEHGGVVLPMFDSTQVMPGHLADWYLPKGVA
jgi:hypothetical protein